ALLRSTDTRKAVRFIKELKAEKIGRQHKKGSGATAVRDLAVSFSEALKLLEAHAVSDLKITGGMSDAVLVDLSRTAMCIASGEEVGKLPPLMTDDETLRAVAGSLEAVTHSGRAAASAFRKVVGAEALMQAADLLNSMRSEGTLAE